MTRVYAGTALALVAAVLGVTFYLALTGDGGAEDPYAECRSSQVSGGAGAIGGPFELVTAAGETVTEAEVFTEPSILYFGYTFCPDVCPLDSARNAEAVDLLEERGIAATPVFVTVDPERDTPAVVGDFAANIHPKMIGLTGSPEQIKAASQAYRTYYKKQEGDPDYYMVDHSTFSYLVLPQVGFVEFFRRETTAEEMAETVACFVNADG